MPESIDDAPLNLLRAARALRVLEHGLEELDLHRLQARGERQTGNEKMRQNP